MATEYRYRAWSRAGGVETAGSVRAASPAEARRLVGDDDLLVIGIEERRTSWAARDLRLSRRSVGPADVAWLARQLATTEKAGLPIKRALETIAAQRHGTKVGDVVADICRRLADGDDLGHAFSAHQTELGAVTVALIGAGAAGGVMAATFDKLAAMTEAQATLRRKIRGALAYPLVVLTLSLVMTAAMLAFIVPTFQGLYDQLNGTLPLPTRILVELSKLLRSYFWLVPALAIGAVLVFRSWHAVEANAVRIDRAKVKIPVCGRLIAKGAVARVANTLAGLLDAGVSTLVAIEMAADAAGLRPLAASLREVGDQVRNGRTLTSALAADGSWPDVMVQLVQIGEETGQVAEILGRYADISSEEVAAEVDRVVNLIEPLMVLLVGAIVGTTVVCLYLPLFDLINLVK